ncbi:S-adenosyl-L-methionine-dependent methyltransferase [Ascodesmis nigricans]|uniref:tRNA (adenine(58)-N(1))-methyltransferase catalytic subunit TRM61 n=1 Tax=Ascodesmis nigricans TaxID=341454 RepID=A0A4S2N050_9PEZI|nr:S-adenosyl-L-methionine-dependent methyltransferase [Ascodesmis nigricans]
MNRARSVFLSQCRSYSTRNPTFQAGDRVLLRSCNDPSKTHFTRPLTPDLELHVKSGTIKLGKLIGEPVRSTIASTKGTRFRASHPTFEEYVVNVARLVTPIYPHDAAAIASLLSIHRGIRVLEAGTGHGSFTCSLLARGADVTTVDQREDVSQKAQANIAGYRNGLLLEQGKVDFRVGKIADVIQEVGENEFDVVFLDLPDPETYFRDAAKALKADGIVAIWCPSVSQIMKAVKMIEEENLPLTMDKTIEFPGGSGSGAGLRRWTIRNAVIRASVKGRGVSVREQEGAVELGEGLEDARVEMVCRPSVGEMIVGGGFLGMFRRRLDTETSKENIILSAEKRKFDRNGVWIDLNYVTPNNP